MILLGVGCLVLLATSMLSYFVYWHITHPNAHAVVVQNADIIHKPFDVPTTKEGLHVMSCNIGWAVGTYQETIKDTIELAAYKNNLDAIVEVVKNTDTDILLLQEVDIDSDRSHGLNQLDYLQEQLRWPYAARATDWDRYIPFEGVGKMYKCAAVLSKYPIVKHHYKLFTFNPYLQNKILNFFYYPFVWQSPTQFVQITYQNENLNVFNVHFSVLSRKNRVLQVMDLINWVKNDGLEQGLIVGGDFNFNARIDREGIEFSDDVDFTELSPFFQMIWQDIPGIQEAFIDAGSKNEHIHQHVTFPEKKQRYDFIFFSKYFKKNKAEIIHNTSFSDHLPVQVILNPFRAPQ